ncbi:sugar phosphate isomerase/epimerase family protein [Paenibacillus prosopidis]|uniref:Sugar phosphate isomerase/epimerase n=1 Tax=Paenibacillus prosopidis TaxID=630520 RepID=A0A368VZ09_9BACL|nr:TIM barrel protein [Paenibacillus prosopidis]RCW47532.1 sugar phosphate isomerase/epimerase [Paenibacillus prosopidis]
MKPSIFIAASVYGAELVQKLGQSYLAELGARSGAAGFEVRRELFLEEEPPFDELREVLKANALRCAISASVEIWSPEGDLNEEQLYQTLVEGKQVGASYVKTTLGTYVPGRSDLKALRRCLEKADYFKLPIQLTVENEQSNHGGNPQILRGFFDDCAEEQIPVSMTFDVGNWLWAGEDICQAAEILADYVVYVHFKWSEERNGKKAAAPLSEDEHAEWREVLRYFSKDLPRVIEFPIIGEDLEQMTRKYVQLLELA